MSGFEVIGVIGAVAAVVSAFKDGLSLFRSRHEWTTAKRGSALDHSLVTGATQVQSEYDRDFQRLGKRFATGDDIARMELMSTVIKLQGTLIAILQSWVHSNGQVHLDLSTLQLASDTSRVESINSLGSLFQRLSVVAPIQQNFRTITSSSYEGFCEGARILQQNDNLTVDATATKQRDPDSYKAMVVCKFCATYIGYKMDYKIKKVKGVKRWSVAARFIIKSHKPNAKYDCIWCQGGCNYYYDQLLGHVEECHGKADFVGEPDIALDTAFTLIRQW